MTRLALLAAAAAAFVSSAAPAAVITYDEAIDGDLPNYNDAPALFLLDTAGVNSWRGSSTTPTQAAGWELDYFNIDLLAGLQITDYTLSLTNIQPLPGSDAGPMNAILMITAQDLIQRYATLQVGTSPEETNPVALPWTDPLAVRTSYARGPDSYYSYDWEVTLTAAPIDGVIPLPAGLPLLGGGLMLLAALRRRGQARAA